MTRQLSTEPAFSDAHASTADESHCDAFNAAFRDLGLGWRWTPDTYSELARISGERDRIRVYLETEQSQLLGAYDTDFLIDAIQSAKARCHKALVAGKSNPAGRHGQKRSGAEAGL